MEKLLDPEIKLITREGYKKIIEKKQKILKKLKKVLKRQKTALEERNEFYYEQLKIEEIILNKQYKNLIEFINHIEVVEEIERERSNNKKLKIGNVAVLSIEGSVKKFRIVGYNESNLDEKIPKISYCAPIIKNLFNKERGETIEYQGKKIQLLDIL